MTAEDKKGEHKPPQIIEPDNRYNAVYWLCDAARRGDVDEVSRLAKWKDSSIVDRIRNPSIINGQTWEAPKWRRSMPRAVGAV